MSRLIFGGAVAIVLLTLYGYSILRGVETWYCLNNPTSARCNCKTPTEPTIPQCQAEYPKELNEGLLLILNLVGGLVSALVIAVLAVTTPGEPIGNVFLEDDPAPPGQKVITIISVLYVAVWLICGIVLVITYIRNPNTVPAVTTAAKSWLGLAVAAAYSYLGVKPKQVGRLERQRNGN